MQKITDFLPPPSLPEFDGILGRQAVNKIGEYLNAEVKQISFPTGAIYTTTNIPYTGKILLFIQQWKATLNQSDQKEVDFALGKTFGLLITTIESLFTISQTAAMLQYNVLKPDTTPIGPNPPFVHIPWASILIPAINDIDGTFSNGIDAFMSNVYLTLGV